MTPFPHMGVADEEEDDREELEEEEDCCEEEEASTATMQLQEEQDCPPGQETPVSHCSPVSSLPFPQRGRAEREEELEEEEDEELDEELITDVWVRQSVEQPSPFVRFPSSHCSPGSILPFPQLAAESADE